MAVSFDLYLKDRLKDPEFAAGYNRSVERAKSPSFQLLTPEEVVAMIYLPAAGSGHRPTGPRLTHSLSHQEPSWLTTTARTPAAGPDHYEHVCQQPSTQTCIEAWMQSARWDLRTPLWCPDP